MKIKRHKAPDNLREKVDEKIHLLEGFKDLSELFLKNHPESIIKEMSSRNTHKK